MFLSCWLRCKQQLNHLKVTWQQKAGSFLCNMTTKQLCVLEMILLYIGSSCYIVQIFTISHLWWKKKNHCKATYEPHDPLQEQILNHLSLPLYTHTHTHIHMCVCVCIICIYKYMYVYHVYIYVCLSCVCLHTHTWILILSWNRTVPSVSYHSDMKMASGQVPSR